MPGITHIPTQYPRHIPSLQPKMPQLIQSLMMSYMQNKYATDRQKEEMDFRTEEARKDRDYKRKEMEYDAKLGQDKSLADWRKDYIRITNPDNRPEGYEIGDVIRGPTLLSGEPTYYVKKIDMYPMIMQKRTKGGRLIKITAKSAIDREVHEKLGFTRGEDITKDKKYPYTKEEVIATEKREATIEGVAAVRKAFHAQELEEVKAGLRAPKTWEEFLGFKTQAHIDEHGKKPTAKNKAQWMLEFEKAKATSIHLREEEHDIKTRITVAETRSILTTAKGDKGVFGAQASRYNIENEQNEVAYWDTSSKWDFRQNTKIIKLSKGAIDIGWTPEEVQSKASISGMTVEQVLKQFGLMPGEKALPLSKAGLSRKIVRTGKEKGTGRKIFEYSDGTVDYAD